MKKKRGGERTSKKGKRGRGERIPTATPYVNRRGGFLYFPFTAGGKRGRELRGGV